MAIKDLLNCGKIKNENEELKKILEEAGGKDLIDVHSVILDMQKKKEKIQSELYTIEQMKRQAEEAFEEKKKQLIIMDEDILMESFALYKPHFEFTNSEEYKMKLDEIRAQQKELIKKKIAVTGNQSWVVNGSKAQGNKMVNDMIKLLMRSFNNECDFCVSNVKFNNIESLENRIEQSYQAINKLGVMMQIQISNQYKKLKLNELFLSFEYQKKKQEEKEEQKKLKEDLREQAKLEKEIKEAREKIAKERKHFSKAIKELEAKLADSRSEVEKQELVSRLEEFKKNVAELENEEKLIDYRENNAKAGYVYIISNIGAFGEGVYKIGMTRRLEPMDRVDELGDASVPFTFDVHSLIFSENAPELESKLHQHFHKNRLNKINNKKEFFRADIKEIERVIKENYDNIVEVIETPPAEQYRESLKIIE